MAAHSSHQPIALQLIQVATGTRADNISQAQLLFFLARRLLLGSVTGASTHCRYRPPSTRSNNRLKNFSNLSNSAWTFNTRLNHFECKRCAIERLKGCRLMFEVDSPRNEHFILSRSKSSQQHNCQHVSAESFISLVNSNKLLRIPKRLLTRNREGGN